MILVIASITVLTMLLATAFTMALQAQPGARRSQDWNAALAAAQAGADDYIARLNQNDTYWTSVDCTNPAHEGPEGRHQHLRMERLDRRRLADRQAR